MAITRPFAYNTGSAIAGTAQHGSVAVGTTLRDYSNYGNVEWFMGPDETRGYIVPHPVPGRPKNMGLLGANGFSESNFLNAVNKGLGTAYTAGYTAYNNLSGSYYTNYRPIVSDGLVLDLDASNLYSYPGSGNTWTSTTGSISGSLANGPTFSTDSSGSIVFDGADDTTLTSPFNINTNLSEGNTVEQWIYWNGTELDMPFAWYGIDFDMFFYEETFGINNGASLVYGVTASYFDNKWTHYACFFPNNWYTRKDDAKMWVNGVELPMSQSFGSLLNKTITNPTRAWIGSGYSSTNSYNFGGKIATTRVYNRELSTSEVLQNYTAQATRFGHTPVVTDSLLLYYDISNKASYPATGSIVTNLWTENITGSLVNGTSYTASNGGTLVFDGVDDHVLVADESKFNFTGGTFSIDAWFKPTVWTGQWNAVFTKGDSAWRMHRYGTGAIAFGTNGLAPVDTYSSTILTAGNWYNVTCVFDGAFKKIYVNGVLDSNVKTTGTYSDAGNYPVMLGENSQQRGRYFNGQIGNAKVYDRALYADEVLQNFSASKDQYGL